MPGKAEEVAAPTTVPEDALSNESSDDESSEYSYKSESEGEEEENVVSIALTKDNLKECISQFPCVYTDIMSEFANVEIFMISLDSMLLEMTAHKFHNWILGGQTAVLAAQVDRFLNSLKNIGGKFKLVWFSDFLPLYEADTVLSFLHSFLLAHISQTQFGHDVIEFRNPLDPKWNDFLHQLTPSFLLTSTDNVSEDVVKKPEIDFAPKLQTIVLNCLFHSIPVVNFINFQINFSSVMAYRIGVRPMEVDLEKVLQKVWSSEHEVPVRSEDVSSVASLGLFWVKVMKSAWDHAEKSESFNSLCSAILLSNVICEKRGFQRVYLPVSGKMPRDLINDRRILLNELSKVLRTIDLKTLKFNISDLHDGRMVMGIYEMLKDNKDVLPYRVQKEYAALHDAVGLTKSVAVDTSEKLFEPIEETKEVLLDKCELMKAHNGLLDKYIPEQKEYNKKATAEENDYMGVFVDNYGWPFHRVVEEIVKKPDEKITDARQLKRINRQKQNLSKWYQNFSESLEGRGSNLLVDFSRIPRGFATDVNGADADAAKKGKGWAKPVKAKPGKPVKLSKKEQILEQSRLEKLKKVIESEEKMISFATQQRGNAVYYLEKLMDKLEADVSKARCFFEQAVKKAALYQDSITSVTENNLDERRIAAVEVIEKLKDCFNIYYQHYDERQKSKLREIWRSLGFDTTKKSDMKLDMKINMIYYQLKYGGRLVDIQSDPAKDDRVTGFSPDGWQRRMLDVVDRNHSALIIAPTSAGKTFVSYYCIEKVLRQSDEDIIVYVSPSKALTNQVCGSVYARFRNKTMSGGKSLFGTLTTEYGENVTNCQVLVTVPECLENLILSPDQDIQRMMSKVKYVIFDEVHSISASEQGYVWEHLLLLIRCPFLALSATIGNPEVLYNWLDSVEKSKPSLDGSKRPRQVDMIVYDERWSELELALQDMRDCPKSVSYRSDMKQFYQDVLIKKDDDEAEEPKEEEAAEEKNGQDVLKPFMPYGVYKPEKLRMFGIPDDQKLTARQIMELYTSMSEVDPKIEAEFEPCKFFKYEQNKDQVWLTRGDLRNLENALKKRFMEWLEQDESKMLKVLEKMGEKVTEDFEKRSKPFNMNRQVLHNIVPLLDSLKEKNMLPAICFNDNREICELLAVRVFNEMDKRQRAFEATAEYARNFSFKGEQKLEKLAKKQRDLEAKKKKVGNKQKGDDDDRDQVEAEEPVDPFAAQKRKLEEALMNYKFVGNVLDDDVYARTMDRLSHRNSNRPATKMLIKLFERGIGVHHEGMNAVERGSVEILFRTGHLRIVFSTSTLALGMNMPCKTVIFGIDTPQLTPLQFRQMSGRAGRRGFDHSGTVIFMSLPTSKIRRLLTASLSTLRGNVPFTTSYLLRLLDFINGDDTKGSIEMSLGGKKPEQSTNLCIPEVRINTALCLLKNSFCHFTRTDLIEGAMQNELKYLTAFNIQLLRRLQLINEECKLVGFAYTAVHMQQFEPGNLLFAHLLQKGALHMLCKQYEEKKSELKQVLVNIFAHLFTNRRLPLHLTPENKPQTDHQVKLFLEPMPDNVQVLVEEYQKEVDALLMAFMQQSATGKRLDSEAFALTGQLQEFETIYDTSVVRPLNESITLDEKFIPVAVTPLRDHRGRKLYLNAYAADFYANGSKQALLSGNGLLVSEIWFLISNFSKMLNAAKEALTAVGRKMDPLVLIVDEIAVEYEEKFRRAFGMQIRG
uniref:Helicase ATP-binding domain-containing protein n=1 Tax=Steinernema glaseri TaxID=37863 RepID=A0A1I8AIS0_9BILA